MASSSVVIVLVLFLAACSCFHADEVKPKAADVGAGEKKEEDVVERLCAAATSDMCHIRLKKKYCVSTLRLDTRSARATEPRDLALVAIDLARRAAAEADAKAAALLERKSSDDAARVLHYCRSDYAAMARLAALCRGTVEAYRLPDDDEQRDPMWMYYGTECVTKMIHAAKNCAHLSIFEQELGEALQMEFIDVTRRAALAKAMVEVMIGSQDSEGFDFFNFADDE